MTELTPDERAVAATAALAAGGDQVTARAVQQAARVNMSVAARAAREWNEQQAHARQVPPPPDALLLRLQGIWREAVELARAEHEAERDGWAAKLKNAEDERDGALEEAEAERLHAQDELARACARIAELEAAVDQARAEAVRAGERISAAESRASAAEGVSVGLREALAALTPPTKKRA